MKTVLRSQALPQVVRGWTLNGSSSSSSSISSSHTRALSSGSAATSSRAAALAKAAEASEIVAERLAAGGAPLAGPSYPAFRRANQNAARLSQLESDYVDSTSQLFLSSAQARRSRAALFGSSRVASYSSPSTSRDAFTNKVTQDQDMEIEEEGYSYASPTGTSTSSIYLPDYVAWAISQLIAASDDPKLLRADHLKLAHLADPQEHLAEAAHIPPKRSSLLHLATVSPSRYAAILSVLSEVRQRLSTSTPPSTATQPPILPSWTPDSVIDYDCAAGEGLWAASRVFKDPSGLDATSIKTYRGFDRRPNLLKSGKKVAESSSSGSSPAEAKRSSKTAAPAKIKDGGEKIEIDGTTYYEQEAETVEEHEDQSAADVPEEEEFEFEHFHGPLSEMSSVAKTFQSVPLSSELTSAGGGGTLALSAFALSLMTNDSNRFEAVQAMWNSGAEVMVIIDQATPRGFASVASARAQLISMGREAEQAGKRGVHVVAPCSHDKPCPLLHPFSISSSVAQALGTRSDTGNPSKSKDVCGFTARFHTPTFLRKTKHSNRGEEDVTYSYVVVRRGERPSLRKEAERRYEAEKSSGAGGVETVLESLVEEAKQTKTGILDLLRSSKQSNRDRRVLEEVVHEEEDPPSSQTGRTCSADAIASNNSAPTSTNEAEMSDDQAMQEMMKLLPSALEAEMSKAPDGTGSEQLSAEQMQSLMESIRASMVESSSSSSSSTSSPLHEVEDSASRDDRYAEEAVISITGPSAEAELAMRLESYSWPRLIRSPLKKGGHVTFDACCSTGNIERFTVSKSSGKQAYQDARKSKWGDLFPHPPKSKSVIKVVNPISALEYQYGDEEGEVEQDGGEGQARRLEDKLVLRAPSKLLPKGAGAAKGFPDIPVLGLEEGQDADEVLRELFEDMPISEEEGAEVSEGMGLSMETGTSSSGKNGRLGQDVSSASYKLISPNLVTPTKKQEKRIRINYAKKWNNHDGRASTSKIVSSRTNLGSAGSAQVMAFSAQQHEQEQDLEEGFQSSLQNRPNRKNRFGAPSGSAPGGAGKSGRSSRKKSRGDWDRELFGHL